MRRLLAPIAFVAALAFAVPASADLRPVRRDFGELQIPRVRVGTIVAPRGHDRGRVRVIVTLGRPPLARWFRSVQGAASARRLTVQSASSRAYVASLVRQQRAAVAQLHRAIPAATVGPRFHVLLNGLTVDLPARQLPRLVRQSAVHRVYANVTYRLAGRTSAELVAADTLAASTGARGDGVKIAVVDDGIDSQNRFFDPTGFSYPPGFPKGGRRWTTPKVIVARSFPGPGSGRGGRLALDPSVSFHGTHVAGIAAGDSGTDAPPGPDHPAVAGLSGVAPRAWLGNYRVFTVPTPLGPEANTAEIVSAFEAAVTDGMDVINFSGGGAETEPVNDAMTETIANTAAAGVVPVISAGNDREEFGTGTAGSPGTAPDAITVAALSSDDVYAPALTVPGAPSGVDRMPYRPAPGRTIPSSWADGVPLVDVSTIPSTDGTAVDEHLCGPPGEVNAAPSPLPARSLAGAVALVSRGTCTFASKARRARAAGAIGVLIADNRPGEATGVPIDLGVPGGMVADEDGRRLRELVLRPSGGRATVQFGRRVERIDTGRPGVVTSFSSAGPTAFGHALKPDVGAPGGQILSSTLPNFGGPFAVFDGTSMAAPHVSGAAALLVERHPGWTTRQIKSALISTADAAWGDTARTVEAAVTLAGGGAVDVARADDPQVFTTPSSLSFGDLNVTPGAQSKALLVELDDAGGGAGTWTVQLRPQAASAGASLDVPGLVTVAPGGSAPLAAIARAGADAVTGENYGFVVLRRGDVERRIPYFFFVSHPALASVQAQPLRLFQVGDTLRGESRVDLYRYPGAPFGPAPDYVGPPMEQTGAERLYVTRIDRPVANFGVSVVSSSGLSLIDPWVLGSKDENDVQGQAGTPVNVNALTPGYRADIGAAGAETPRPKTFYVSVDSGRELFTGRSLAGRYLLRSWVDDVTPPLMIAVTRRVSAGRPTLVLRAVDAPFGGSASGVDPLSLAIGYGRVVIGAAAYDPVSGLVLYPIPGDAPRLRAGRPRLDAVAADYQEAKNLNTTGTNILPNTSFGSYRLRVVAGPTVTWLAPEVRECASRQTPLLAVAGSTASIRSVTFFDGKRRIARDRRGPAGLFDGTWRSRGAHKGRHLLRAVVLDAKGRRATAERVVRVCG